MCTCGGQKTSFALLPFLRPAVSLASGFLSRPGWLTVKTQGYTCPYLHNAGITVCHSACFLFCFAFKQSQALTEPRPSHSQGKQFIHGAPSPGQPFLFSAPAARLSGFSPPHTCRVSQCWESGLLPALTRSNYSQYSSTAGLLESGAALLICSEGGTLPAQEPCLHYQNGDFLNLIFHRGGHFSHYDIIFFFFFWVHGSFVFCLDQVSSIPTITFLLRF